MLRTASRSRSDQNIVHRALERDPGRRFGGAREMMIALREALRVLPHTTDATVLAASVKNARKILADPPKVR